MKRYSVKQSMKQQVCSKLADLLPVLPLCRSASEWQFQIFTVHSGRSTGRSTPTDLPVNGNFRFLLFIVADQLADLTPHRSANDWEFQIFTV